MDPSSTDDESSSDSCSSCSDAAAEICTVCQGYLDVEGETTCTLGGCGHRFHANCIVHALQYNRACPNCRYAPSTAVDNVDRTTPEDEEEEDVEAREAARALARRRTLAIRSTLARARFGRVAPEIQKAIKQYRAFTGKVAAAVTEQRAPRVRTRPQVQAGLPRRLRARVQALRARGPAHLHPAARDQRQAAVRAGAKRVARRPARLGRRLCATGGRRLGVLEE